MIDLQDVLDVHRVLIQEFGGSQGIRDEGLLKSAIERPLVDLVKQRFTQHLKKKQVLFWKVLSTTTLSLMEINGPDTF